MRSSPAGHMLPHRSRLWRGKSGGWRSGAWPGLPSLGWAARYPGSSPASQTPESNETQTSKFHLPLKVSSFCRSFCVYTCSKVSSSFKPQKNPSMSVQLCPQLGAKAVSRLGQLTVLLYMSGIHARKESRVIGQSMSNSATIDGNMPLLLWVNLFFSVDLLHHRQNNQHKELASQRTVACRGSGEFWCCRENQHFLFIFFEPLCSKIGTEVEPGSTFWFLLVTSCCSCQSHIELHAAQQPHNWTSDTRSNLVWMQPQSIFFLPSCNPTEYLEIISQ